MPTTTSHPSHLDLTPAEFERRLAAHGRSRGEIRHLWGELAPVEEAAAAPARSSGSGR